MVTRTVLTKSGPILLNIARPVNTVQSRTAVNNAGPMKNVINNAYSSARRPFNKITATNNSNFTKKVNTIKGTRVNTARPKAVISAVKGNKGNVGNPYQDLKDKGVIDSRCSRHMIGNRSYLTDYEEIDRGFVAFGGNSKGGKITGKDFKLTDESHVLLKVSRKDNMYSVDLKNVIPQGGLTCHFAKATPDESNLWHRRLGHVNFKTMNKLVRGNLVRGIENLIDLMVKVIRCDNGTEFKNRVMNQFCKIKGIKREFSVAKTPQQNGVAERKNRTLIETPYELFLARKPALSFTRPFGCPVTILNTIDHLGKFDGKADEGFFVGYSTNIKAFKVFNSRTRIVDENLHVQFTVVAGNQSNGNVGTKAYDNACKARMETVPDKDYILLPMWPANPLFSQDSKSSPNDGFKPSGEKEKKDAEDLGNESKNPTEGKDSEVPSTEEPRINQENVDNINNTNNVNAVSSTVNAVDSEVNAVDPKISIELPNNLNMPELEDIVYSDDDEDVGAESDMNNLDAFMLMDVKSAFLYGKIEEEVYVCQPPGFEDPDFPDRVYKVEKALYGLHQAPKAWYKTLSTYLLDNGFQRGKIDKTLFIRKDKGDILLVKVYVDDIIFGSTKKSLCTEFEKMMHKKFQISSMGELTFFLGLQVKQKEDGIFISQDKYVTEILKKFSFSDVKTTSTPMETHKPLLKDADGEDVDEHLFRSMIRSLMYLTSSRPDIMFAQTVVANSTTEAKYIAASNCCGQVLWIQNQLLDYGYNFMQTKIHIDNESTICIVKNPVFHSKTKHIKIRHHFIRDSNEKKLI
ncbi:uncharacterized mitochondrial protein-like protein [Tanacetum coccineum]